MATQQKNSLLNMQQTVAAIMIAALLFSSAMAQTPAQQQQSTKGDQGIYKMRVESELVLVNVVARDKQGKPVTDLKQSDFTLLEDGKAQRISSFDFENLETKPLAVTAGPSQQTQNGPAAPAKPILTTK